jgi:hypothetical protein
MAPDRTRKGRMEPILSSIAAALTTSNREFADRKRRLDALRIDAALAHDVLENAPASSAASPALPLAEGELVSAEERQRHLAGELRFLEHLQAEVAAFARHADRPPGWPTPQVPRSSTHARTS